jgi:ABC-type cobalamin/Fe3+-siderophores transport system ATPase subunit
MIFSYLCLNFPFSIAFSAFISTCKDLMKDGTTAALGRTEEVLKPATIESIYGLEVDVFKSPDMRRTVVLPK